MKNFLLSLTSILLLAAAARGQVALQRAVTQTLAPAQSLAVTSSTGASIDVHSYFGTALLVLNSGTGSNLTYTLLDSSSNANFQPVTSANAVGLSGSTIAVTSTTSGVITVPVLVDNCNQYLEVSASTTGTNTFSASFIGFKQ